MALKFIDSFDHYQTAELSAKWTNLVIAQGIRPGVGRCGSQAMEMGGPPIGGVEKGIAFNNITGILGFAIYVVTQTFNQTVICHFGSALGSSVQVYLTRQTDGSLAAWRADPGSVLLGTSAPDLVREAQWYYIEFKAVIDAAAGVIEVRINGVTVLLLTGINTFASIQVPSPVLTLIGFNNGSNYTAYIDDVYVLDETGAAPWNTFLGDVRVEYLRPDGAGAHQDWDLIGAPSHWQAVDDAAAPDDDLTYIHTATAGLTDTQTYLPTGLPSGTIFGLQVNLYARKTDSGPRSIAPVIRHAGGDHTGLDLQPSFPVYRYLIQVYSLNPGTGLAWTIGDVNAVEVGVTVTV